MTLRNKSYHRFVGVLLKLYESDPSDVLEVDVAVGRIQIIVIGPVEVGGQRRGCHADGLFPVDLVSDDVLRLQ